MFYLILCRDQSNPSGAVPAGHERPHESAGASGPSAANDREAVRAGEGPPGVQLRRSHFGTARHDCQTVGAGDWL